MTRSGLDHLRSAVRRHIEREGLRPLSVRTGIPVGQLRSLIQGRAALSTTLERVSTALDLEFYIGPPRKPGDAPCAQRVRGSHGPQASRARREAVPAWAVELQRELRAGIRQDLAQVLRELTAAKPDSTPRQRPADSPSGPAE